MEKEHGENREGVELMTGQDFLALSSAIERVEL